MRTHFDGFVVYQALADFPCARAQMLVRFGKELRCHSLFLSSGLKR
jgi:hypothetical protein